MEFRYVGDLVNTHGVKGEVRILSDTKFKKEIFKPGRLLYIGKQKDVLEIERYRVHKIYDMLTFKGIYDINDVLLYKGDAVYINKEDVVVDGYFDEDIIDAEVYYNDILLGTLNCILKSKAHDIFSVIGAHKCLIPVVPEYIESVDIENKKVVVKNVEGLLDED